MIIGFAAGVGTMLLVRQLTARFEQIEQGTTYGPEVRFVYTFPQPGEYRVWMQFKRAGEIMTVPLIINVQL